MHTEHDTNMIVPPDRNTSHGIVHSDVVHCKLVVHEAIGSQSTNSCQA